MEIIIKRVYEPIQADDGYRVLVDRLWPRGVQKEALVIDEWDKAIAPSADLRRWFNHQPERFSEFSARYQAELSASTEPAALLERAGAKLTLVYAAKNAQINHAVVLRQYLQRLTTRG